MVSFPSVTTKLGYKVTVVLKGKYLKNGAF